MTTLDRIVDLLRNEVSREQVQSVVTQQDSLVTQFVTLLRREETKQAEERQKDAITITDTQCKP